MMPLITMLAAAAMATGSPTWTTLGTNSGPIPRADRSEPANLLRFGDTAVLVDAGDGASVQLAKAGVPLAALHAVVISHLHFDHTGGLFAVIAERYQMLAPGILTIYGPPGIRATVAELIAAMMPSPASGPRLRVPAADTVKVIEVNDGDSFTIGVAKVTAAANSHYAATPGNPGVSLSYRFDLPGRSIAYTGDTGPSAAVERLAHGVDLLVSEIIDPAAAVAELRRTRPDVAPAAMAVVRRHFEEEHLTADQVGMLASRAGAKALVLTHDAEPPVAAPGMTAAIRAHFAGAIRFARDLDTF